MGCCYSGIGPDYPSVLAKARKDCMTYDKMFRDKIPTFLLAKQLAELMQENTQRGGIRPFGISLLVGGVDHLGPKLYQVDPSGAFVAWKATAVGKNAEQAKDFLEKRYEDEMELEDAIQVAMLTLREGFEGEMNEKNIEVGVIDDKDATFRVLTPEEVKDRIEEAK